MSYLFWLPGKSFWHVDIRFPPLGDKNLSPLPGLEYDDYEMGNMTDVEMMEAEVNINTDNDDYDDDDYDDV